MIRRSMSTKVPESGRFDQLVSAVTWKRISQPLPEGAAVTSGVPSASAAQVRSVSVPSGSASTWRWTSTSLGHGQPGERALLVEARRAAAASARTGCRRARGRRGGGVTGISASVAAARRGPAKRTSVPPFCTHCATVVLDVGGQVADVGHDDHRGAAVDQFGHRDGGVRLARLADVGEGLDGAGDVVERREQRLRGLGRGAGEEADPPAAPAVVEELHRAGGLAAGDFEAHDVVPEFDRQREFRLGRRLAGIEGERRFADDAALRMSLARTKPGGGHGLGAADHRHGQRVGCRRAAGFRPKRSARIVGVGDDRPVDVLGEACRANASTPAPPTPSESHATPPKAVALRGRFERGRSSAAWSARPRARRQRIEAPADLVARRSAPATGWSGSAVASSAIGRLASCGEVDDAVGGRHHRRPRRRRRPAVVDDEEQRPVARRDFAGRFEDRAGEREDHGGGEQQAERRQPPRAPRRLFFLPGDFEEEPRRRELLQPRLRRHRAAGTTRSPAARASATSIADVGEGERAHHAARPA